MRIFFVLMLVSISLFSCREDVDPSQLEDYTGPTSVSYNIVLYHSDSAIVRTKLMGDKQMEFANGDYEFPEGIEIHFFEKDGEMSSTIQADKGFYDRQSNLYRGEGDVRVNNLQKNQKLNSEELFWDPDKKIIYTEKFVTVQEEGRIINGTGLEADEGFNEYQFKKVTGILPIPGEE
ncbi:LPS export ABC transporter periplasmic protein LptC [Litoribacter ruber]|uniref:LPS export ABC transporter periplasmic protein LptC n=1 Tax=Litoribacter ruber TaxID=702568 RepID=A0AAP2G3Z8_9BACT|nr:MULTISPECIES: LPS export ABC transporter periplasmic protein LptC [Litoribacter]MBS9523536.1 LPS export ABC transporter periplasmic protein LptC [Litoribacter alkaliphilus]MBT0812047.1 LPS export ABC transporter periplasmic protein LptC [Litoribacter ruber]